MTGLRRRRQLLVAGLAAALVLLAFLAYRAGADRFDPEGQSGVPADRAAVVQRAKALAARAMSYDAATASTDVAEVEREMTPEMRVAYERTLPSPADRAKQSDSGAKVVAKVVRAGLISLTEDEASVLVYVNQQASAKTTQKILESPTWEIVHLTRIGAKWLLSGMEAP